MRIIGVIHGLLRPEALAALEGSALILHAGDVGDARILDTLARIAPVHAVHGNTDHGELRARLPRTVAVDLGSPDGLVGDGGAVGPLAWVHHGDRGLDLDPGAAGIALVVSGHTHRPLVEESGGVLYLNPGSAGPKRFTLPPTVARVRVGERGALRVELLPLEER